MTRLKQYNIIFLVSYKLMARHGKSLLNLTWITNYICHKNFLHIIQYNYLIAHAMYKEIYIHPKHFHIPIQEYNNSDDLNKKIMFYNLISNMTDTLKPEISEKRLNKNPCFTNSTITSYHV